MFCEGTGRKDKERKRSNNKKMGGTDQQNTDKTHRFNVKMIGISFDFSSFYVFFFIVIIISIRERDTLQISTLLSGVYNNIFYIKTMMSKRIYHRSLMTFLLHCKLLSFTFFYAFSTRVTTWSIIVCFLPFVWVPSYLT